MRTQALLIGLASGLIVGQASGQLAPPPPDERTHEVAPLVKRPPRPEIPAQTEQTRPPPPAQQGLATPDVPFEPIVELDESGYARPIHRQIALMALKHNPLVGAETIEAARPAVIEWVNRLDLMVIDNIDLVLEVEAGFFDTLDFMVQEGVMEAQVYREALFPKPALLDSHLITSGVVTDAQRAFNAKLISEYVRGVTLAIGERIEKDWAERIAEENGGEPRELTPEETEAMRKQFAGRGFAFTFEYLCSDAVWSLHRQLAFAGEHLAELYPDLGLSEEHENACKRTIVSLGQTDDPDERRELMVDLISQWDFDAQEALLFAAMELRGPLETLAELEDAVNKPGGLAPREDLKDWKPGDPVGPSPESDETGGSEGGGGE